MVNQPLTNVRHELTRGVLMRRIIVVVGSAVFLSSATVAADLPRPMLSPAPPLPGWTGFYFGGNVGGGWAKAESDFSVPGGPVFASAVNSLEGLQGGVQAGYNWQSGPAVFGVEADF